MTVGHSTVRFDAVDCILPSWLRGACPRSNPGRSARLSEKDFVAGTAIQIAMVGFKKISLLAAL
jgi:hypothetical protein